MVFRVHGVNASGSETFVDIECDSEAVARNIGVRRGLASTSSVEVISDDMAVDVVRPSGRRRDLSKPTGWDMSLGSAIKIGFGLGVGLIAAFVLLRLVVLIAALVGWQMLGG